MADLPKERVSQAPPFTYVGADCFGPFIVKDRRTELKRYGLIFTCLYSRAIHLELLDDMSTDAFINSFRSLVAIRGSVRHLRTDRGTNFVGVQSEFNTLLDGMKDASLKQLLIDHHCDFVTNTPHSSHMGGVWERQIRTVRTVLQNMLKHHAPRLDTSSLRTFLYETMAIVNSRPLSILDNDSIPLTPNMLLTMKSDIVLPPPGDINDSDLYSRKRWLRVQSLANAFWQRWKQEYLSNIQTRQKWSKPSPNLKVGDIVVCKDHSTPRTQWPLAVITDVKPSQDGLIRSVTIQLGNRSLSNKGVRMAAARTLERPIHSLIHIL